MWRGHGKRPRKFSGDEEDHQESQEPPPRILIYKDSIYYNGEIRQPEATEFCIELKKLVEALVGKDEFTPKEWEAFCISDLASDRFIKAGNKYFTPVECSMRYLQPQQWWMWRPGLQYVTSELALSCDAVSAELLFFGNYETQVGSNIQRVTREVLRTPYVI